MLLYVSFRLFDKTLIAPKRHATYIEPAIVGYSHRHKSSLSTPWQSYTDIASNCQL